MAIRSTNRFSFLRWEPGNPLFPTLPDGIIVPHVTVFGRSASHLFETHPETRSRKRSTGPALDEQRFAGWQTETTWISPSPVDFGIIPVPVQRTITLYNARSITIDVTAASLPPGASLVSPALPVTLQPFAGAEFVVEASNLGDPTFDDFIIFTTSEDSPQTRAFGQRIFTIEAQPQRPVTETLRFKTDVLRSRDATEATYGLLNAPNSTVRYKIRYKHDTERAKFRNQIMSGQSQLVIGAQKWYESRPISSPALSTDTVIQVDTTEASFTVDQPISVVTPQGVSILATIASFDASSITLANALGTAAPSGSQVMPVGLGYIQNFPKFATYPVNAEDADFVVTFNRQSDAAALSGDFPLVDGLPVLEECNEIRGQAKPGGAKRSEDVLDSGLSNRIAFNEWQYADENQKFDLTLQTRAEVWKWRQWLYYQRGSYREFYVPSKRNDLPGVNITLASVTFDADFTDFGSIAPREPRKWLRFEYDDGTILYREVNDVVDNGTFETVTILGGALPVGTPKVSFMSRARIVGDSAKFKFLTPSYAELAFEYRTVQI